jgi:amino acid transporter
MGLNATWAMAVGGMIGGGIFSVLGVVIMYAGALAWLSFVLAGIIALLTAVSYVRLAQEYQEGGGAFLFLRRMDQTDMAGSLSWVLTIGYVLTIAVYAFTFGHYISEAFDFGHVVTAASSAAIVVILVGINLVGVAEASMLEVVAVWFKLAILGGVVFMGFMHFEASSLVYSEANPGGLAGALVGAASIFMAYEGFQLLTYDYEEIRNPQRTLAIGSFLAILSVISVYVLISLSVTSLVPPAALIAKKEIALAAAGEAAAGLWGKITISVAAALSTATAINATLFATARLSRKVADDGEMPMFLAHRNKRGVPDYAVILLGGLGLGLALVGGLEQLVEIASLAFLTTFAVVNYLAARHLGKASWPSWLGLALTVLAAGTLSVRLALSAWWVLALFALLVGLALVGRPILLKKKLPWHTGG